MISLQSLSFSQKKFSSLLLAGGLLATPSSTQGDSSLWVSVDDNVGRNILQGPSLVQTDISAAKKVLLSERLHLQFRSGDFQSVPSHRLQHSQPRWYTRR